MAPASSKQVGADGATTQPFVSWMKKDSLSTSGSMLKSLATIHGQAESRTKSRKACLEFSLGLDTAGKLPKHAKSPAFLPVSRQDRFAGLALQLPLLLLGCAFARLVSWKAGHYWLFGRSLKLFMTP